MPFLLLRSESQFNSNNRLLSCSIVDRGIEIFRGSVSLEKMNNCIRRISQNCRRILQKLFLLANESRVCAKIVPSHYVEHARDRPARLTNAPCWTKPPMDVDGRRSELQFDRSSRFFKFFLLNRMSQIFVNNSDDQKSVVLSPKCSLIVELKLEERGLHPRVTPASVPKLQ